MITKAAIYCRISDGREGSGLGVTRQEEDCRALAEARGWTVTRVFVDNDISAYSGKPRPSYKQLLNSMREKDFDAVITWHTDRLHRSPSELEDFITVCEGSNIRIETVQAGLIDLSTPSGRMVARMLGSAARYESEHKSERIKRKATEVALAGKVWGGSTRPYGYERDRVTVIESEAAILREVAARFLAGESLMSLVGWLNKNEYWTTTGGHWYISSLRRVLYGARWSGQREHLGEIVAKAVWPAIVTVEQTTAMRIKLSDPARRTNRSARRYLLAGLLRCELCGERLVARPRPNGTRRYVCSKGRTPKACGRIFIKSEDLEVFISAAVLKRIEGTDMHEFIANRSRGDAEGTNAQSDVTAAKERQIELANMFAKGEISRPQLLAGQKTTDLIIFEAMKVLAQKSKTGVLESSIENGISLANKWATLNLDRQRAIIFAVIDSVKISSAVVGVRALDPDRIHPIWRI
jgi:site-specific DNA recombinase